MDLETELKGILNKHSRENHSNTPDWILAEYMMFCLNAFECAVQKRAEWYGRMDRPGHSQGATGLTSK